MQGSNFGHLEVTSTDQMHSLSRPKMRATNVAIECNRAIAGGVIGDGIGMSNVLVTIHKNVRVSIAPNKRTILDSRYEERQLLHFVLQVSSSDAAGKAVGIRRKSGVVVRNNKYKRQQNDIHS